MHIYAVQTSRCRGKVTDELPQRTGEFPSVEYDGRIQANRSSEGRTMLRQHRHDRRTQAYQGNA
jgi:hypothetical protein